jgi:hypothetical protein
MLRQNKFARNMCSAQRISSSQKLKQQQVASFKFLGAFSGKTENNSLHYADLQRKVNARACLG